MKVLSFLLLLITLSLAGYCNNYADSLENSLSTASSDQKIEITRELSYHFRKNNSSKAVVYGEQYLELARTKNDKYEELKALNNLGIIYYHLGFYETTLNYFIQVLEVAEAIEDKKEIAKGLNNLGNLYDEIGDKERAIDYYQRSLVIKQNSDDRISLANTFSNLGYVYYEIGDTKEADKFFKKALKIDEEENNIEGSFVTLNNIGLCFIKKQLYDSALYYIQLAFSKSSTITSFYDKASMFNNLALVYYKKRDFDSSILNYNKALEFAIPVKARSLVKDAYKGLADIHADLLKYEEAMEYYKKFTLINDSIFSESNSRRIANLESDYKVQKREKEIDILKKEAELHSLILVKNRQISYFLIGGLLLFVFLVLVLFQKYKFKSKAISLLKKQNEIIATKNLNITDSIIYARGIQEAIIPDDILIKNFFQDYFIYSKPRDIVNGDFYWFADKGDYIVMAVVDCTGHGVPGAFMNVIGHSLLNQIVIENEIRNPSCILYKLNEGILTTLHQDSFDRNNKDGMDVGIISFEKSSCELTFSGAKHDLVLFKDGALNVVKGSNYSIGGNYYHSRRVFQDHKVILETNDAFYLYTDGVIDQFGEKTDKKWMCSSLRNLLSNIYSLPMKEQEISFDKAFKEWKGNVEQTDDVLLIGVKM